MDVYAGRFSPREVLSWLQGLPPDSALRRELDPDLPWGLSEQLLAAAVDALHAGNWQRAGDPKAPRPKPLSRPGVTTNSRRHGKTHLSREEALAILRPTEGGEQHD